MKPKIKAIKMFMSDSGTVYSACAGGLPVFVLVADAESYDAMVQQTVSALCKKYAEGGCVSGPMHTAFIADSKLILASLGITKPTPDSAKKKRLRKDGESASLRR